MAGVLSKLERCEPEQIPKTIIFCQTKNNVCKVYKYLKSAAKDKLSVGMYHASMTKNTKTTIQNEFARNSQLKVLIATVAFGMVINGILSMSRISCIIRTFMI